MRSELEADVAAAVLELRKLTGRTTEELFGERIGEGLETMPNDAARRFGFIEGVAQALGVTVLELLDELDID